MSDNLKTLQREEAIARLEILEKKGLHPNVLREFKASGRVNYSERVNFAGLVCGVLYWLDGEERYASVVQEFEEEHGALVYHLTHERTSFGELIDLFYISREQDEWELDREDLNNGYALSYVHNFADPDFLSEFGGISYTVSGGGLVRTL